MKTISLCILFGMFLSFTVYSQKEESIIYKNELASNLLDLVVAGSLNMNYERLLDNNQSIGASVTLFDTYSYYDVGYIEKNSAFSLKVLYLIYFSKQKDHEGFFFYPQMKFRTGKITTDDYGYYDYLTDIYIEDNYTYDIGGVSAGFGLGHKWIFNHKISLSLSGEIGRNLGNFEDTYLDEIEARFAVNFGFRF